MFPNWAKLLIFCIMHFIEQPVTLQGCGILTVFCLSQGDAQKGEAGERGPGVCTQLECLPKKVILGY